MPREDQIPSTIERPDEHAHAQKLWSAAHDSAVESYGEGERAHRTAFAAHQHEYEKVGDHWERKVESGPSGHGGETAGGVDTNATRAHLLDLAKRLTISVRPRMTEAGPIEALQHENTRRTLTLRAVTPASRGWPRVPAPARRRWSRAVTGRSGCRRGAGSPARSPRPAGAAPGRRTTRARSSRASHAGQGRAESPPAPRAAPATRRPARACTPSSPPTSRAPRACPPTRSARSCPASRASL
ncbi:hypothetical protein C5D07_01575 [Rathayibacter tritici]|nr:hypothetical protein C5C06_14305 [Rathayibacter tritici]PPI19585.1 hypothetical protein C5D07_01575 [Rathayibacter tritici]